MPSPFIDPQCVEELLDDCLVALDAATNEFTDWEHEFLEGLDLYIEEHSITEAQWTKLRQIYDEKVRNRRRSA